MRTKLIRPFYSVIVLIGALIVALGVSKAHAEECYFSSLPAPNSLVVGGTINGETFVRTFLQRADAVHMAKVFNLCVRDYGVEIDRVDPVTRKVLEWEEIEGTSVWKPRQLVSFSLETATPWTETSKNLSDLDKNFLGEHNDVEPSAIRVNKWLEFQEGPRLAISF